MLRVNVLILIGAVSVLTLTFYPYIILHKRSKIALFERYPKAPKKTTKSVQNKLKDFYNDVDNSESDEITPQSWNNAIIVHGIHKPHPPDRSQHWHRLNLFQELMGLRRWPLFSPDPRYDGVQTSDEILSVSEPTSPISLHGKKHKEVKNNSITLPSTKLQGSDRVYLIKDLYKNNHFWPHSEICSTKFGRKSDGTKLLVVVTSSVRNRNARKAIRYTWGHYTTRIDVVVVFLLGLPAANYLDDVLKEDSIYRDLVIGNTPESNMDATLKSISVLEWVNVYCSNIHAVLKAKDDVFINIPKLMGFLTAPHRLVATKTIWGKLMHDIQPERNQSSLPYFLPRNQYSASVLPDFLLGSAYVLTIDAVPLLFYAALELPHMRLEDVFITGTLADKVKVKRVDVRMFLNYNVSENVCAIKKGIAFEKVQFNEQFHMWQQLHDTTIICRNIREKNKYTKKLKTRIIKNSSYLRP